MGIETHLEDQRDERTRQYGEADEKGKTCEHTAGETRLDGRAGREETWLDGRAGWRRSAGRNDTFVGPQDSSHTDFFIVKIVRVGGVAPPWRPWGAVLERENLYY